MREKYIQEGAAAGGFGVSCALGGARRVTMVDVSSEAKTLAEENWRLNGLKREAFHFVVADVFGFLRDETLAREAFDFVVLDPPAFAKSRSSVQQAARGYKDVNRLAMKLLREGWLFTCSCSQHVDWKLFQQIVFSAAMESGKRVQVVARRGAGADHPFSIYHPEGEYLKCFLLWVGDE